MKKHAGYEAGFVRTREEDEKPFEDPLVAAARSARRRRFAFAAVALLAVAAVAAAVVQLRRDTPAKQLARAKAYITQANHRSAMIELKHSLQGNPEQPAARFLLGQELAILGDGGAAGIEFRKALDGGIPPEQVLVPLVDSTLRQGQYDAAVALVNNATIESPEINAELQTMLGTAYLGLRKTEAGLTAYAAARELVPNFSGAQIAEARYLIGQRRFEDAGTLLAGVAETDKRQDELQALTGDLARIRHQPEEAARAYEKSVKLDPANMTTRLNLAQAYLEMNDLAKAKAAIAVVVKAVPGSGRAQFVAALVAFLQKDLPTAHEAITQSVQLTPGDVNALVLAGAIALQLDELVEAEGHLARAILLMPDIVQARQYLADLYLLRNEADKAEEVLRPVLASMPTDRDVATLAARIALQQGNFTKASQLFDRIGVLASQDAKASLVSASLRFAAHNDAAGFDQLAAAAKANPDDREIDVAIITNRLRLRQFDAATAAWRTLQAKEPDSARSFNLLALIQQGRGDQGAARQSLESAVAADPFYFPAVAALAVLDVQEKKVDDARKGLRAMIASAPHPTEALLLLARIEAGAGTGVEQIGALLQEAQRSDPRSQHVVDDTIAFYAAHNDQARQLAAALQGIAIAPNNQYYLLTAGDLLQKAGRRDQALTVFTRLSALNNENPDYPIRLGVAQLEAGQSEAALMTFRNTLKRYPKRVDLQMRTVSAFLDSGRTDEAARMLFEVSHGAPMSPILTEYDADIKTATRQFPEAIAGYKRAMVTLPNSKLAIKMTRTLDLAKQRNEGTAVLTDWLKQHPKDELVTAFDAQRALNNKDYERAATGFRKLVDAHPTNPVFVNNYAWTLGQRNDPQAIVYAEKAIALAPNDPDAADTLGTLLIQRGESKRGLELIQRASEKAPSRLEIRLHLAKAQIVEGRHDAARTTLQALIGAAPDSVEGKESKTLLQTL